MLNPQSVLSKCKTTNENVNFEIILKFGILLNCTHRDSALLKLVITFNNKGVVGKFQILDFQYNFCYCIYKIQ